MIVTEDKISTLPISDYDKGLLKALLIDLEEINHNLPLKASNINIDWIDVHNEYSPERVDPCPDYYGYYRLWQGNKTLGVEMDLETLDYALCLLHNFVIEDE
jgi:hypothetical protein